jgi:peptidoglycan/LPS O-acetylase OafA/YrhL
MATVQFSSKIQSRHAIYAWEKLTPTLPKAGASELVKKQSLYRPELDVLRFLAFFGVFLFHTIDYSTHDLVQHKVPLLLAQTIAGAMAGGRFGVNLFFVLSSYLITDLLVRENKPFGSLDVRLFYLRRILRIWPLYYFILFLTISIPIFDPAHLFGLKYVLPFSLLAGNWALVAFGWPIGVAALPLWSVSVEEQFYLLWPPVVARLNARQIIYAALGLILIANLTRALMLVFSGTSSALWGNTFAHLDSIAAGILIAIFLHGRTPTLGARTRIALVICRAGCIALRGYFQTTTSETLTWGITLFGWPLVAVSCAAILVAYIGTNTGLPWLQYLGKISYDFTRTTSFVSP